MTLTEARKRFLAHCNSAINLSHHSLRAYSSDLDDIQRYFGLRRQLTLVKKEQLRQYIHHLREQRQLKETTIKRRLASFKLLLRWAQEEQLLETNPFDTLYERIRLPKRLPRALDRGDHDALRKAITLRPRIDDFDALRLKTAIHLLLDTGIRVGELAAIDLDDVSMEGRHVVIHGKGNRQRLVYLLQKSLHLKIERYLTSRSALATPSKRLFVTSAGSPITSATLRAELRNLAEGAGITRRVTPHMLRHTCATQWLEAGLDIRYVQKLLGHQSISTTEIYTHVSDQGLREALFKATGGSTR
ncbi:hypothetical protein PI87_27820 [Ralstonia sp. A12]|uniref:tyrosine-type recombinase/integrase n=1 Tax=Ralstonia sp. A12 TaxID=1217052 RepID=UPI000573BAF4|nr:tyrosine-type recombinase/integrase [Ralstonia sp. A12]KHK48576.1 hypothetical protein PI87_27820 [Ralstonia sp. A12]